MTTDTRIANVALVCLLILHGIMLASLFAGVEPHPPAKLPPFGMAPFISLVICATASAILLGATSTREGRIVTTVAIAVSLVSFGPHKLVDPAFPQIWPAVLTAWVAIALLAGQLVARAGRKLN